MARVLSAQSEQDDTSDTLMMEEYERLHNQLRISQNNRQKQAEETSVKMVDSAQNRKQDMKCIENLKQALKQQDEVIQQSEELKTYGKKIDNESRKLEKLIQEKHQERCAQAKKETEQAELQIQIDKKVSIMENNLTLAKNAELRDWIERARNERNIYSSIHEKFEEKLMGLNKLKSKLMHHASAAYDQRTEAKNRNSILKEKNDKDNSAYELEIKELQRIIDHNDQLNQFMAKKSNERLEWKQEAGNRIKKYGSTGEIARRQRNKKIQEYKQAMMNLEQITNKNDVEQMIRYFKRNEDDNFTLFKYVTELNNEIEVLNEDILNKKKAITDLKKYQNIVEKERHSKMHILEVQMNADKAIADEAQINVTRICKILDEVKSQIKTLTFKLECDVTKIIEMLGGDGEEVTERNLILYLSALEQRVDELLSVKYFTQINGNVDNVSQEDLKAILSLNSNETPKSNHVASLHLPSLMDEEEIIDDVPMSSVRPLTQAELVNRVTKELQRFENKYELNSTNRATSPTRRSKLKI